MTIHQKLSKIRSAIVVKKTGYNKYGKYPYYELESVLAAVKPLFKEHALFPTFNLVYKDGVYMGILKIIDIPTGDCHTIQIDSPLNVMSAATPAQQAGANATYQQKYCYCSLLMLDDGATDPDKTNKHGKGSKPEPKPKKEKPNDIVWDNLRAAYKEDFEGFNSAMKACDVTFATLLKLKDAKKVLNTIKGAK